MLMVKNKINTMIARLRLTLRIIGSFSDLGFFSSTNNRLFPQTYMSLVVHKKLHCIKSLMCHNRITPQAPIPYEETPCKQISANHAIRIHQHRRTRLHLPVLRLLQSHPYLQSTLQLLQRLERKNTGPENKGCAQSH